MSKRIRGLTCLRRRGETLQEMIEDLGSMAHKTYAEASSELLATHVRDQILDPLENPS